MTTVRGQDKLPFRKSPFFVVPRGTFLCARSVIKRQKILIDRCPEVGAFTRPASLGREITSGYARWTRSIGRCGR
ncbi:hypothetical protein CEXT_781791 [Caerostris extrusa]|uniref:Uncharacterized protein n=1 Tax=Caerostris extrusa TaxID=172846 RepID=A0AAV4R5X7_CAEEX|nr:hypothetical protein CEXT_781791 [Caerostris extrusa]